MMEYRMEIDASELAHLIRASNGRPVPAAFGPGYLGLKTDQAPWAVPIINELRGVTVSNGGGI